MGPLDQILQTVDRVVRPLTKEDYAALLEELIGDLSDRLSAVKSELRDE
jgi:hypothetical protein